MTAVASQAEADAASRKELAKKYKLHLHNRVGTLIAGAVFAHLGVLIVVALYYGITQVHYDIFHVSFTAKNWWDSNVTPSSLRHNIRDVGEGVLGALGAKAIMWNHFSKSHQKAGRIFDWMHEKAHIPEVPAALLSTAVIIGLAFAIGTYALDLFHYHLSQAQPTGGSLWNRTQTLWTSNYDKKALAFVCTFIGSRPMHTIYDDIQGYFAGRRASRHKKPHLAPKAFKNRYAYLVDHPSERKRYSNGVHLAVTIAVPVALALAAWGYYILTYVA